MEETEKKVPAPEKGEEDQIDPKDVKEGEEPEKKGAEAGAEGNPEVDGQGKKPKQSKAADSYYANKRREEEEAKKKKAAEDEKERIRRQAGFDVEKQYVTQEELDDLNLSSIEDEADIDLVKRYREAKKKGDENPARTAYNGQRKAEKEARAKAEAEQKAQAQTLAERRRIALEEQARFRKTYGKETWDVMNNEPEFKEKYGPIIEEAPGKFTELYAIYLENKSEEKDKAKDKVKLPSPNGGTPTPRDKPKTAEEQRAEFRKKYGRG